MNDQACGPAISPAARKRLLRRIYPSTWFVMLLAAGVMFLVEFPGSRDSSFGPGNYQHGWPMVWMEGWDGYGGSGSRFPPGALVDTSGAPIIQVELAEGEESRDPWSLRGGSQPFEPKFLAVDVVISLLAVVLVGSIFQWWRRRHGSLSRFRLRTLLLGFAVVAMLIAPVASWHRERQKEQRIIERLKSESIAGVQVSTVWSPPNWLPDRFAKIGGFRRLFDRVSWIKIHGDRFTDATLAPLAELSHLGALEIPKGDVTDSGFQALSRLSSLDVLKLSQATVTDQRLEQLSKLSALRHLFLDKTEVTDDGLAALAPLHDLFYLKLASHKLTGNGLAQLASLPRLTSLSVEADGLTDDALAAIEHLQTLTDLTLSKTPLKALDPRRLPRLAGLNLPDNTNLESVDLRGMAHLRMVSIRSGVSIGGQMPHPAVRLAGTDALEQLELDGAAVDAADLYGLPRRPNLLVLQLKNVQFRGDASLELVGQPNLQFLEGSATNLTEIHVADAPKLRRINCSNNPRLAIIRLERLPGLGTIDVTNDAASGQSCHVRLELHGLADLTELDSISIRHPGPIAADLLNDLSNLPTLRHLALNGECLRDEDMPPLSRLDILESLDLSHCNITGEGLVHLQGLSLLDTIDLRQTPVGDETVAALRKTLPNRTQVLFEPKKPTVDDLRRQAALVRNRLSTSIACKLNPEKLGDRDFECLADLDSLESLDLSKTHLTDAGLQYLRRLPKLHNLVLRRTQITDAAIRILREIPALRSLDIEKTQISDEGRRTLGTLIARPSSQ